MKSNSATNTLLALIECLSNVYNRYLTKIISDRDSDTSFNLFQDIAMANMIELQLSLVEDHNTFEVGK